MSMNSKSILSLALTLALATAVARAETFEVDQNDALCDDSLGTPFCSLGAATVAAEDGDTIIVAPGAYQENLLISSNVKLLSAAGRALTTIRGISGVGRLGTVVVTGQNSGVQIGDSRQGFTIIGIDNGMPAIENAAVYFQGSHSGAVIIGNEIVAQGDHGLVTEFGATITDFLIARNLFTGRTFLGDTPAGCGFSQQFSLPNVPRQLVVMGGGSGGGNTSRVTFEDNRVSGRAGGANPACALSAPPLEQGNTLVTIDAARARIVDNRFDGVTARFGTSLRARGPDTLIRSNDFGSRGQTATACYVFLQEIGARLSRVADRNRFDRPVAFIPGRRATSGSLCVGVRDSDDDDDDEDDDDD